MTVEDLDSKGLIELDDNSRSHAGAAWGTFLRMLECKCEREGTHFVVLGDILDTLEEQDLADDTAVIIASDHGDFAGSHRQFNKGPIMYDDTYQIPIVVRWPNHVEPDTTCDEFVQLHDLMPTIIDIAGLDIPDSIDGRSIRPLLEGDVPEDWRESVYCEYHGDEFGRYTQRMIRTHEHKYVYNSSDVNELYDLQRDPTS